MAVLKSPRNNKLKKKWAKAYVLSLPKRRPKLLINPSYKSEKLWHSNLSAQFNNPQTSFVDAEYSYYLTPLLCHVVHKTTNFGDHLVPEPSKFRFRYLIYMTKMI